jgi:hypothetical protein
VNRLTLVLILVLSSLMACTGSFEDSGTPVRLVLSVNPSSSKEIACIGQKLTVPKPGLVLLDPNRFSSTTNQTESCGAFVDLPGVPFNAVNGAELTGAPSIFVSIPSQSVIRQFIYAPSSNNNTVQEPNTLTQKLEFKYTPKDVTDDPAFCPTQLAIIRDNQSSGNNQRLAVLDNPNDVKDPCGKNTTRLPRIVIFNTSDGSIFRRIDISKVNNFINGASKEISIALLNNRLYVLGEFASQYKITSFDLNAADPNAIENTITSDQSRLPPTYSSFPTVSSKVNLSLVQNGLLASLSDNNSGQVFPIVEDTTLKTIAFGEERRAGSLATDPPLGKTTAVRSNASSPSISSNFTLFLRPNNILFQRSTQFATQSIDASLDATFPADNTIWVLNASRLRKVDTRDFPEKPQFDTGIDLTDLNPGNLVWTLNENQ